MNNDNIAPDGASPDINAGAKPTADVAKALDKAVAPKTPLLQRIESNFGKITLITKEVEAGLASHFDVELLDAGGNPVKPSGISISGFDVYWDGDKANSLAVELIDQLKAKLTALAAKGS